MARLRDIVFDCRHPASLARFWAAALDDYEVAPYDDAEVERLRSLGVHDVEDDPTVLVESPGSGAPRLWFQRVTEPKTVKNRVHLDLIAGDADEEAARLQTIGGVMAISQPNNSLIVMNDPEGNELCILR